MADNDPGVEMWAQQGSDISVDQGGWAQYALAIRRVNGYTGPICLKEMFITNPAFKDAIEFNALPHYPIPPATPDFPDAIGYLIVKTKTWPPGGYHLQVMAYDCNEPVEPPPYTGPTGWETGPTGI